MILSFRTDGSWQTVQTQIWIRVYTICNSVCIFWTHDSKVEPHCSNFRISTAVFRVSEYLGVLRYLIWSLQEHYLRALRHIPSILKLHIALFQKYQRKLDKAEASTITVDTIKRSLYSSSSNSTSKTQGISFVWGQNEIYRWFLFHAKKN